MTKNQLEYWKNQYEKHHNYEVRKETERSNRALEREQSRANRARERETLRANRASERLKAESQEQTRINNERNYVENAYHNARLEQQAVLSNENDRSRVALGYYQADRSASVGMAQAGAAYANVAEATRSHQAQESEIHRSNLINEGFRDYSERTARINANTNATNATTRASENTLNWLKWGTQRPNTEAQTNLLYQQALTSSAQRDRWAEQSHVDRVNAFGNVLGSVGKTVASFAK